MILRKHKEMAEDKPFGVLVPLLNKDLQAYSYAN